MGKNLEYTKILPNLSNGKSVNIEHAGSQMQIYLFLCFNAVNIKSCLATLALRVDLKLRFLRI